MSRRKHALGLDPRVGTGSPIRTCATQERESERALPGSASIFDVASRPFELPAAILRIKGLARRILPMGGCALGCMHDACVRWLGAGDARHDSLLSLAPGACRRFRRDRWIGV